MANMYLTLIQTKEVVMQSLNSYLSKLALEWTQSRSQLSGFISQPGKIFKKIFKVIIFYMKKLRKNLYEYRLYML